MRQYATISACVALTLAATGCAFESGLNPAHFQYTQRVYDAKVAGKGAIEMPKSVQAETFKGNPTSFTGGGTTLAMPMGLITREAATTAFGDVFTEGVALVEATPPQSAYAATVKPRVTAFSYQYNQLRNLGFAVTPMVEMSLTVSLSAGDGKPVWERVFQSGNVEGETYFLSGSPGEEISKTAHRTLMKLMQEAADAVHRELRGAKAAASGTSPRAD